jgi:hypothetical protein
MPTRRFDLILFGAIGSLPASGLLIDLLVFPRARAA